MYLVCELDVKNDFRCYHHGVKYTLDKETVFSDFDSKYLLHFYDVKNNLAVVPGTYVTFGVK